MEISRVVLTYYIITLGCPKNQADSRQMEHSLRQKGYAPAASPEDADINIINSCAFIQDAREETIETVLDMARWKSQKPNGKLVLAGCFAQRYNEILDRELPELDLHFGTGRYHQAGELIEALFPGSKAAAKESFSSTAPWISDSFPYAPLKISEGCNRRCSFCSIPSFRGLFRDIPRDEILDEARLLAGRGVKELDVVSQDTISYCGGDPTALMDLLEELSTIHGIEWIRLFYLYPDSKLEKFLRLWIDRSPVKLVPYLESPVQHVSDSMLKAMGRAGSGSYSRELFRLARSGIPGLEIRTSFIVGFPGEGEKDVDELITFIKEIKPEKLALFPYSPEEGTEAAELGKGSGEAENRINELRAIHLETLSDHHRALVGKRALCMIDELSEEGIVARRQQDAPEVDGAVLLPFREGVAVGELCEVVINGSYEYDLTAEFAGENS